MKSIEVFEIELSSQFSKIEKSKLMPERNIIDLSDIQITHEQIRGLLRKKFGINKYLCPDAQKENSPDEIILLISKCIKNALVIKSPEEEKEKYLSNLKQNPFLKHHFIGPIENMQIEDLFVELNLVDTDENEKKETYSLIQVINKEKKIINKEISKGAVKDRQEGLEPRQNNKFFILGPVNSGKSTMLKYFLTSKARNYYKDKKAIPVFFTAKEIFYEIHSLKECKTVLQTEKIASIAEKMNIYPDYEIHIFIDGFDEIGIDEQRAIKNYIINLGNSPHEKFIICSRDTEETKPDSYFTRLKLSELTDEKQNTFINNYLRNIPQKRVGKVIKYLRKNAKHLINSPGVLNYICITILELSDEIINDDEFLDEVKKLNRFRIYERVLRYILEKHPEERSSKKVVPLSFLRENRELLTRIVKVDFDTKKHEKTNLGREVSETTIKKAIEEYCENKPESPSKKEIIEELIESNLLVETSNQQERHFQFLHQSWKEFFLSKALPLLQNATDTIFLIREENPSLFLSDSFAEAVSFYLLTEENKRNHEKVCETILKISNFKRHPEQSINIHPDSKINIANVNCDYFKFAAKVSKQLKNPQSTIVLLEHIAEVLIPKMSFAEEIMENYKIGHSLHNTKATINIASFIERKTGEDNAEDAFMRAISICMDNNYIEEIISFYVYQKVKRDHTIENDIIFNSQAEDLIDNFEMLCSGSGDTKELISLLIEREINNPSVGIKEYIFRIVEEADSLEFETLCLYIKLFWGAPNLMTEAKKIVLKISDKDHSLEEQLSMYLLKYDTIEQHIEDFLKILYKENSFPIHASFKQRRPSKKSTKVRNLLYNAMPTNYEHKVNNIVELAKKNIDKAIECFMSSDDNVRLLTLKDLLKNIDHASSIYFVEKIEAKLSNMEKKYICKHFLRNFNTRNDVRVLQLILPFLLSINEMSQKELLANEIRYGNIPFWFLRQVPIMISDPMLLPLLEEKLSDFKNYVDFFHKIPGETNREYAPNIQSFCDKYNVTYEADNIKITWARLPAEEKYFYYRGLKEIADLFLETGTGKKEITPVGQEVFYFGHLTLDKIEQLDHKFTDFQLIQRTLHLIASENSLLLVTSLLVEKYGINVMMIKLFEKQENFLFRQKSKEELSELKKMYKVLKEKTTFDGAEENEDAAIFFQGGEFLKNIIEMSVCCNPYILHKVTDKSSIKELKKLSEREKELLPLTMSNDPAIEIMTASNKGVLLNNDSKAKSKKDNIDKGLAIHSHLMGENKKSTTIYDLFVKSRASFFVNKIKIAQKYCDFFICACTLPATEKKQYPVITHLALRWPFRFYLEKEQKSEFIKESIKSALISFSNWINEKNNIPNSKTDIVEHNFEGDFNDLHLRIMEYYFHYGAIGTQLIEKESAETGIRGLYLSDKNQSLLDKIIYKLRPKTKVIQASSWGDYDMKGIESLIMELDFVQGEEENTLTKPENIGRIREIYKNLFRIGYVIINYKDKKLHWIKRAIVEDLL